MSDAKNIDLHKAALNKAIEEGRPQKEIDFLRKGLDNHLREDDVMSQEVETMNNNLIVLDALEQGSPEWLAARIGCITMSNAKLLLTGGKGVTRDSYIMSVASEVMTGVPAERINTWDMERGTLLEPYAADAYEAMTGFNLRKVGLGYLNSDKRISASPDGLKMANGVVIGGVEIKCQAPKNHMKTILSAKSPDQFKAQKQGNMWVFGVEEWDYCSFCPEFKAQPLVIIPAARDNEMIARIEESALKAVKEVDEYVRLAGLGHINDRIIDICAEAVELIDIMQNKEPEIL